MTETCLLRVTGLEVSYATRLGHLPAVRGVDMELAPAEIRGLVGEFGSGKSTVARTILGLSGSAARVINGTAIFADKGDLLTIPRQQLRRVRGSRIGYVGQNSMGALHPILTIEQQFRMILRAHGVSTSRHEDRVRSASMLELVGLREPDRVLSGHAHELSGGMAQRVVIAMAFLLGPDLVIADEPTTALDLTLQRQILELILGRARSENAGMILVTHDLGVVAQYCDTVTVLYGGKVMESGDVRTVLTCPAHPYTGALLRSVPRPGKPLYSIPGRAPNPLDPMPGCPFRDRCERATEVCATEPPLEAIDTTQRVACHYPIQGEPTWR